MIVFSISVAISSPTLGYVSCRNTKHSKPVSSAHKPNKMLIRLVVSITTIKTSPQAPRYLLEYNRQLMATDCPGPVLIDQTVLC